MGEGTRRTINLISVVLFAVVDLLLAALSRSAPFVALVIMVLMLVGGATAFAYGLVMLEKYRNVFDYEPTVLWGRPSNGKAARSTLMAINSVGLWSFLAAGILMLLRIS